MTTPAKAAAAAKRAAQQKTDAPQNKAEKGGSENKARKAPAKKAPAKKAPADPKPAAAKPVAAPDRGTAKGPSGVGRKIGHFVCTRPMLGDKQYDRDDPRDLEIREAIKLVERGALVPKDKATLDLLQEFRPGLEAEIYKAPAKAKD